VPQPHTSRDFESELRELRAQTLAMGARCEQAVDLAVEAFLTGSLVLAAQVDRIDRQIDRDEVYIDALALRSLALRQPVAYDLRLLTGALRLATDLERAGDEALNIAERAGLPATRAKQAATGELTVMGEGAHRMLRGALESFAEGDLEKAAEVIGYDDVVDQAYGRTVRAMTELIATSAEEAAGAVGVIQVSRSLERVADHAVDIAEEIIFIVQGDDVRHRRWRATQP